MAVTFLSKEHWNIASRREEKEDLRATETLDFEKNYLKVAQKISLSLTQNIINDLGELISNHYKKEITLSEPKELKFSLQVWSSIDAARMRAWCGEEAQLAPFCDWFDAFIRPEVKPNKATDEALHYHTSFAKFEPDDKELDLSYFQSKINQLGHHVATCVQTHLNQFSSLPKNGALHCKTEWISTSERSIKKSLDLRDNYVSVKIWLDSLTGSDQNKSTKSPWRKL